MLDLRQRDGRLKVVALAALYAQGLALDRRRDLDFDSLSSFWIFLASSVHAILHGDRLFDLVAADGLRVL